MYHACQSCGRSCEKDRHVTLGDCNTGLYAKVASYSPHHGEEDVLRGKRGSGTIFFSNCNLSCKFC